MTPEHELLQRFGTSHCEESFRRLVEKFIDLVHSVAFRTTRNHDLAKDVTQQVFAKLAARPHSVPTSLPLSAWLHKTTHSLASNLVRGEERRKRREEISAFLNDMRSSDLNWESLAPIIDNALGTLKKEDRVALLLRFYERKTHAAIGHALQISENAARARVSRALEKLRLVLGKRGIATTAAALSTVLPANACVPAPAGLAGSVTSSALSTPAGGLISLPLLGFLMNTKTIAISTACVGLIVIPWQQSTLASLRKQSEQLSQSETTGPRYHRSAAKDHGANRITRKSNASTALRLARIQDPIEREAALALWAANFTSNHAIQKMIRELKNVPGSTTELRALIAPHLTRQWALVDAESCTNAFLKAAALENGNPFAAGYNRAFLPSYFDLIRETNPEGFQRWIDSAPVDLYAAMVLRDPNSKTLQSWPDGQEPPREYSDKTYNNHYVQSLLILSALSQVAPRLIVDVISSDPRAAKNLLYGGDLADRFLEQGGSLEKLWILAENAEADESRDRFLKKLTLSSIEDLSFEGALRQALNSDSLLRQGYELAAIGNSLAKQHDLLEPGDSEKRDVWWTWMERFANTVSEVASPGNASFDVTRAQVATLAITESRETAIEWAETIVDPERRLRTAIDLSLVHHGYDDLSNFRYIKDGNDGTNTYRVIHREGNVVNPHFLSRPLQIHHGMSVDAIMQSTKRELLQGGYRNPNNQPDSDQ